MRHTTRSWFVLLGGVACWLGRAAPVRAEGFISPLIGFDFGGDASCPQITNCSGSQLNVGGALGVMGSLLGFEEEIAYAPDFFGNAPGLSSSVLTLMSNAMVVPKIGPVRPYVLAGIGLIKTHVQFTPSSVLTTNDTDLGWDIGGGAMVEVAPHVAVRGDLRYFHAVQSLNLVLFTVTSPQLDFGRASVAVVLTF